MQIIGIKKKIKSGSIYSTCILALINFAACSIYKMDLRQGNELQITKLNELKPRMSKKQVQNILGTTTLNPMDPNRLDYFFNEKNQKSKQYTYKHLILYFDKNGELNHYEGDLELKNLPTTVLQNQRLQSEKN